MRPSFVVEAYDLRVPGWVEDLDSFHRWVESKERPPRGRIDYLGGELWVDMGEEHQNSIRPLNGQCPPLRTEPVPRGKPRPYALVIEGDHVAVPAWVTDLASFRRWAGSVAFPEHGRVSYLAGEIWIDMSMEQLFTHNKVKTEFFIVLGSLIKAGRLGDFFSDGASISCPQADLSTVPDAMFLSRKSMRSGRVRLVAGARQGFVEVEGSPDMVLEVVSDGSVRKDTVRLRELYRTAQVREYWLVDARRDPVTFDILRRAKDGFAIARRRDGWVKSAVFGKEFRLRQRPDEDGHPEYTLSVR